MKQRRVVRLLALVAVLTLIGAACSSDDDEPATPRRTAPGTARSTATPSSSAASRSPRMRRSTIGTLLAISGDGRLARPGQPGRRDARDRLPRRDVRRDARARCSGTPSSSRTRTSCARPMAVRQAGTALAADPSIVAVIGTSCSSAALGVADTILCDKGILLISPSNTNPGLTARGAHQPVLRAHRAQRQDPGCDRGRLRLDASSARRRRPRSTTRARTPTAWPRRSGRTSRREVAPSRRSSRSTSEDTDFKPVAHAHRRGDPEVLYFPDFNPACTLIIRQAADIMPDTVLIGSDGCLSTDFLETAGAAADGVFASSPDLSVFADGDFYKNEFIPAYQEPFGTEPNAVFHAHSFDATNILFDAIEAVAVENDDGSLTIPRQALRDAIFATSGYEGITGTITCRERVTAPPTSRSASSRLRAGPSRAARTTRRLQRDQDAGRRPLGARRTDGGAGRGPSRDRSPAAPSAERRGTLAWRPRRPHGRVVRLGASSACRGAGSSWSSCRSGSRRVVVIGATRTLALDPAEGGYSAAAWRDFIVRARPRAPSSP